VSVAAPGAYHVPLAVAALERGAAVLLEKPIAMSGAECARLLDAAAASSGWVMPAHILRFTDPYPSLRGAVRDGAVGQVLGISARRERGIDHEWRFRGVHPALMTMVHDIDLAIWISGSRAARVTAEGRRPASADGPPLLLWATVQAEDGSVWSLRVSWLLPDGEAIADRIEVFGADGVTPAESWGAPDALEAAIDAQLAHFCECAREGRRSDVVTLEEAAHGIAIAEAVMRSAAAGGASVDVARVE
jgi:predicted dehydrogenase